ncbi:YpmS family protein [Lentilactobacillus kribbianus]|uniref:YpmS family protein n=1 Tax=Lentilactobacillus kribbianus TaxID=2729622 RepID=UPI0015549E62|nr:YpmS family protein [Lentilactobacillus kribbianus]
MRNQAKKQINPWKWGFMGLIILIVLGLLTTIFLIKSNPKKPVTTGVSSTQNTPVAATFNKKQINALSDYYLNKQQAGETNQYHFKIEDQAIVYGTVTVLGSPVNYSLFLTPNVESNGNVTLKATKLSVGKLRLPISVVMALVQKSYKLPDWVTMNPAKNEIYLDINHINNDGINYRAKKMDMSGSGKFVFEMILPNQNS